MAVTCMVSFTSVTTKIVLYCTDFVGDWCIAVMIAFTGHTSIEICMSNWQVRIAPLEGLNLVPTPNRIWYMVAIAPTKSQRRYDLALGDVRRVGVCEIIQKKNGFVSVSC